MGDPQSSGRLLQPGLRRRSGPALNVFAAEDPDERVRVAVAHAVLGLEPLHLLHVGKSGSGRLHLIRIEPGTRMASPLIPLGTYGSYASLRVWNSPKFSLPDSKPKNSKPNSGPARTVRDA